MNSDLEINEILQNFISEKYISKAIVEDYLRNHEVQKRHDAVIKEFKSSVFVFIGSADVGHSRTYDDYHYNWIYFIKLNHQNRTYKINTIIDTNIVPYPFYNGLLKHAGRMRMCSFFGYLNSIPNLSHYKDMEDVKN